MAVERPCSYEPLLKRVKAKNPESKTPMCPPSLEKTFKSKDNCSSCPKNTFNTNLSKKNYSEFVLPLKFKKTQ